MLHTHLHSYSATHLHLRLRYTYTHTSTTHPDTHSPLVTEVGRRRVKLLPPSRLHPWIVYPSWQGRPSLWQPVPLRRLLRLALLPPVRLLPVCAPILSLLTLSLSSRDPRRREGARGEGCCVARGRGLPWRSCCRGVGRLGGTRVVGAGGLDVYISVVCL